MKKWIVLLALLTPGLALAGGSFTTIHPGVGDDHKIIFTTPEDGRTRISDAYKLTRGIWLIFDDKGRCSTVFDFSNDRPRSEDD